MKAFPVSTTSKTVSIMIGTRNDDVQLVCSTKRPLTSKTGQKSAKKKREAQENELLEQAILCMKNESQEKQASKKPDDDDLFGQFITAEIRSIQDPYIKRQTKWKIQSAINEANSILYAQQAPVS